MELIQPNRVGGVGDNSEIGISVYSGGVVRRSSSQDDATKTR